MKVVQVQNKLHNVKMLFFNIDCLQRKEFTPSCTRQISGKGVRMYKGVGVRFAEF